MKNTFKFDLKFDRDLVMATIISTTLLLLNGYHNFTGYIVLDRVMLYLIVPLLVIVLLERRSPGEYGFQLGDWRAGLTITILVMALAAPILWLTMRSSPAMQQYYGHRMNAVMPVFTFLDLIGWEFLFRGWLLFNYARHFGPHALWLQAVPFAMAHMGKPEVETYSTIFGGFIFGLVAWRTRSFLYPFLIHWFISSFTILLAGGYYG